MATRVYDTGMDVERTIEYIREQGARTDERIRRAQEIADRLTFLHEIAT